jgi:hypothetical protein
MRIGILEDDVEGRRRSMVRAIEAAAPGAEAVCHADARDFIAWLEGAYASVGLVSLDHDLVPLELPGGGFRDPGSGMDVADFLASRPPAFPVIVHTSNPDAGPRMQNRLEAAGWRVARVIPMPEEWISSVWRARLEEMLHG